MVGVIQDITERKRSEEALRKYKSMVSATRDLMVFVDPTYTYQAVNAAYCEAHGKTREQVLGHTVASVLGERIFETTLKPNLDRCLAGERMKFEFWWDSPALGRRHADARYDPFCEADGSVLGVFVVVRDDTERQYAQEELGKSHERLRNLAERLNTIREDERTVIARELHDELGQVLVTLRWDLHSMSNGLPDDLGHSRNGRGRWMQSWIRQPGLCKR
jgi:PAS domain S-box-containing protein